MFNLIMLLIVFGVCIYIVYKRGEAKLFEETFALKVRIYELNNELANAADYPNGAFFMRVPGETIEEVMTSSSYIGYDTIEEAITAFYQNDYLEKIEIVDPSGTIFATRSK